jgi:hypothetical protein
MSSIHYKRLVYPGKDNPLNALFVEPSQSLPENVASLRPEQPAYDFSFSSQLLYTEDYGKTGKQASSVAYCEIRPMQAPEP